MDETGKLEGAGTLERTPGGYRVQFVRTYERSQDELWDAITSPEGLDSWYPTRLRTDGVVGSAVNETFEGEDGVRLPAPPGTLTAYEPPRLFEYRTEGPVEAPEPSTRGLQTIRMETQSGPDGDSSTLVFTHDVESLDIAVDVLGGWHYCLEFLALTMGADGEPTRENLERFKQHYQGMAATAGQPRDA